jgi:hypothetical protein
LRDDTATHAANKPAGGWYVTPIHAVLQASNGKVVVTGTKRTGQQSCNGSTQRNYGVSFVLDPAQLDAIEDGATLPVQPIAEQARDADERHVLYCSGQVPLADGRILYVAGTDYPRVLPITTPELGLDYSRVFDPSAGTFERIEAPMKGGQAATPGMKWYPTNRVLPDGRVLIMGGYHWSVSGTGDKENRSLELFDPAVWDADPNADPYTVLTQPQDIPAAINTAGRAYTHVFLLPKPVPASKGGGLARTVAHRQRGRHVAVQPRARSRRRGPHHPHRQRQNAAHRRRQGRRLDVLDVARRQSAHHERRPRRCGRRASLLL